VAASEPVTVMAMTAIGLIFDVAIDEVFGAALLRPNPARDAFVSQGEASARRDGRSGHSRPDVRRRRRRPLIPRQPRARTMCLIVM